MAIDYRQSGGDVEEGYRAVGKYKAHAKRTSIPGVLNGLGSFAGMFEVPAGMKNPVMVSGTDGVGTKLDIAFEMKKYDTVGIDCVAMSVNDILCTGAKPLYFLDYVACGKLDADVAADLVKGVAPVQRISFTLIATQSIPTVSYFFIAKAISSFVPTPSVPETITGFFIPAGTSNIPAKLPNPLRTPGIAVRFACDLYFPTAL